MPFTLPQTNVKPFSKAPADEQELECNGLHNIEPLKPGQQFNDTERIVFESSQIADY